MKTPSSNPLQAALPIAAVERETGISKDTLRVWEKRYGFPAPVRSASDDRLYPPEQVQRLKQIRRLIDGGYRPGKVVGLDDSEIQKLLDKTHNLSKTKEQTTTFFSEVQPILEAISTHNSVALRDELHLSLMRKGVRPFVQEIVAPLTTLVGDYWAQGKFEIFEEHLYTECITTVLRNCLVGLNQAGIRTHPKVLLTTLPNEQHGIGLLMVETILSLEGCRCISLGTQTPIGDIVLAAAAHQVDVVALSFTELHNPTNVLTALRDLRKTLPASTALWAGGSCPILYQKALPGISALHSLQGLPDLISQWR